MEDISGSEVMDIHVYDFVRFTIADIHGIARCQTVVRSEFKKFFMTGTGMCGGMYWLIFDTYSSYVYVDELFIYYTVNVFRQILKMLRKLNMKI